MNIIIDFIGDALHLSKFSKVKKSFKENADCTVTRSIYNQDQKSFVELSKNYKIAERALADYLIPDMDLQLKDLLERSAKCVAIASEMKVKSKQPVLA